MGIIPYKNENEIENSDNQSFKNNSNSYYLKEENAEKNLQKRENKDLVKEKNNISEINYIQLNKFLLYLGFCFIRKIKNVSNVLLNEGMSIIKEKLDIFNLLRNTILNERMHKKVKL